MVPEKMNQLRFSPERYDQITRGPDASMLHRNPRARPPPFFFFDICAHFKDGIFLHCGTEDRHRDVQQTVPDLGTFGSFLMFLTLNVCLR